jgi:hypothetical protein
VFSRGAIGSNIPPRKLVLSRSFPSAEFVIPLLCLWFGAAISGLNLDQVLRTIAPLVEIVNLKRVRDDRAGQRAYIVAVLPMPFFVLRQVATSWAGDHPPVTCSVVVLLDRVAKPPNPSLSCWKFAKRCPHRHCLPSMAGRVLWIILLVVHRALPAWSLGGSHTVWFLQTVHYDLVACFLSSTARRQIGWRGTFSVN